MLNINLQGEAVTLLARRGLLWPAQKALVVADLHWGKTGHFRKHGIAVPVKTQEQDEIKLAQMIKEHKVERLIVAGDLFHSRENKEVGVFSHWRKMHESLHVDLVLGNHDILPKEKYTHWQLNTHQEILQIGPFLITHDAPDTWEGFCIHGHIHPAVRVQGKGRQSIKLDCFCEDENRLILPAFGQFTGNKLMHMPDHKHIYVIAENTVMQWK